MWLTLRTTAAISALTLGTAVVAGAAAQVCHPDAAGTRSFTVKGAVTHYGFAKGGVAVSWTASNACSGSALWNFQAARSAKADTACAGTGAKPAGPVATRLVAKQGGTVVRVLLAPRGSDRPDRLAVVNRATHETASWPLIDRPTRVALYGDLAVLSTAKRHAVYALRITDGRIALVGITQPGDRPVIGAGGLLYQDDSMVAKDRDKLGRLLTPVDRTVTLKLVPLATVGAELDQVGTMQVSAPIRSFSMDGPRVAYAVSDPRGACDQIRFWNIPWRFMSILTKPNGASCLPAHAPGGITNVALAGSRALWTTTYGSTTRVLAALDHQLRGVGRGPPGRRPAGHRPGRRRAAAHLRARALVDGSARAVERQLRAEDLEGRLDRHAHRPAAGARDGRGARRRPRRRAAASPSPPRAASSSAACRSATPARSASRAGRSWRSTSAGR